MRVCCLLIVKQFHIGEMADSRPISLIFIILNYYPLNYWIIVQEHGKIRNILLFNRFLYESMRDSRLYKVWVKKGESIWE